MATRIEEDTRQALHLSKVESSLEVPGNQTWLSNEDDEDALDEYTSDPAAILEHREQVANTNCFGRKIN